MVPIAAAAMAADTIASPLMAHLTNVKNRQFTREMYNRQRQDNLSDYHMQNAYNSPREQMRRFQEAGLNPNLIYGRSNEGAVVKSASASGGQAESPRLNAAGALSSYFSIQQSQAQTDLLQKQLDLMQEDIGLRKVQQYATLTSAGKNDAETKKILFDLGLSQELKQTTIEGAKAGVEKTKAETISTLDKNIRDWEMQSLNVAKTKAETKQIDQHTKLAYEQTVHEIKKRLLTMAETSKTNHEIFNIQETLNHLKSETIIKALQQGFAEEGMAPGDSYPYRVIQRIAAEAVDAYKRKEKDWKKPNPKFDSVDRRRETRY